MRFLSKIRERQFAKKWGGAYNLSRAVLTGVLAAGCLMPGFAEAASFHMEYGTKDIDYTEFGNTATIIKDISGVGTRDIYWNPATGEGCTIIVNNRNIEPEIYIYGGKSSSVVTGNTVTIKDTTFTSKSYIYGGTSESSVDVTGNKVEISGNTTFQGDSEIYGGFTSSYGDVTGNKVEISGNTTFQGDSEIYGGYSRSGTAEGNSVIISGGTFGGNFGGENIYSYVYGGYSNYGEANYNKVIISGGTINGNVHGGRSTGTAEDNSVIISGGTINGNVWGGYSDLGSAINNKVILVGKNATYPLSAKQTLTGSGNIEITGVVAGAHALQGNYSGSEIHVYGSDTKVGKIECFNTLRFFIDDKMTFGETMLTIKGVTNPPQCYHFQGQFSR